MTPDQVKLLIRLGLVALFALACVAGGWMLNGWRLGKELQRLEDQGRVLVVAVNACAASVENGKRAGDAAIATGQQLLDEARRQAIGGRQAVQRIEALIAKKPPARADGKPAGCDEAWDKLEMDRKARVP